MNSSYILLPALAQILLTLTLTLIVFTAIKVRKAKAVKAG
jgi:hypothetical protein